MWILGLEGLINHDCKNFVWTDPGWSILPTGSSDFILILGCMTSNLLVLELFHFLFQFSRLK